MKLKEKPKPSYLRGTAASRAMQRPKSNMLTANPVMKNRGINAAPMSLTKKAPTSPMNQTTGVPELSSPLGRSTSEWIEDIPIDEMKLDFESFKANYQEFAALSDLTTAILQQKGVICRELSPPKVVDRRAGIKK